MTDPALLQWARLPGPAKLLAAARERREAGHGMTGRPLRVVLTSAERDQVGKLLGTRWVLSGRQVGAKMLAAAIESLGADLDALLTETAGPLRNLPEERAAARRDADRERALAASALAVAGVPAEAIRGWLARRGLPRAGGGQLLELATRCGQVWRKLPGPADSTVLLTVLAAETLGDPHALDRGSTVAVGVLRLLDTDLPATAEAWRDAWEEVGVVCDPVSSRVLVLNLILRGDAAACRLTAAAGPEPLWLTWRSLSGSFGCEAPDVHVCENPSVLIAAADQLGADALPLVCTNGRPSAAARRLLTELATRGATIHARADDDAAGHDIINALRATIPSMRLWRYPSAPATQPRYEEQDLPLLLQDLRSSGAIRP
ncbi:MAG: TIGR02679 domain-containing protein [Micromonosporaceae bacterium]